MLQLGKRRVHSCCTSSWVQLEQHRESMGKMQDTVDVMAFQMNKMGTVNRGQLGCTM